MIAYWILLTLVAAATSYVLTPVIAKYHLRMGLVGVDVHKKDKPMIPEACGLAVVVSQIPSLLLSTQFGINERVLIAYLLVISTVALIGYIDDKYTLDAKSKTLLPMVAALPVVLLDAYVPRPYLPFVGQTRLTILYPALAVVFVTVVSNAVNMADTHNGVAPTTALISAIAITVGGVFAVNSNVIDETTLLLTAPLIGAIAGYLPYNVYPAKVFNGDSGSLAMGAALAVIAIATRTEIVAVTVMMPYIVNGFHSLVSIGGLLERREIKVRPVIFNEHTGEIIANKDPRAPLTLVHMLVLRTPLSEREILIAYIALFLITFVLSVITALLTY